MSLTLAYPSVSVFPQSSILLKDRESRDSTPTETTLGALIIAAAQIAEAPGAHNMRGNTISNRLGGVG